MARRTKEEALETRNLILDTAERMFSERGVAHTSLADIATAAELTRGAIYWHFKNKCELFVAMVDRELLPMDELMAESIDAREPDPLGRLRTILVKCLLDIAHNPRRCTVIEIMLLKWEHTVDMQPVIDRKRDNVKRTVDVLQRAIANAIAKGQLPNTLDTTFAANFLHSLILGALTDHVAGYSTCTLLNDAQRLIDSFLDMLRCSPALLRPSQLETLDVGPR
ncbi:TetR family transcriptional regulator [Robbsia andropogonis]|uniref:TetR family transcriptional regulator n=1 Tax=Robbsia andropogonis TaxID=28092 RepID=UPI0004646C17|nr:TetR family transcriptional regulator [Robbsia andropogonis]MCP1116579.1 TetR family transcriptional regulator [Robbsia andropogonis]MCP1126742.1 TetR family transcriptional regulator [Robbsia andropogonis]